MENVVVVGAGQAGASVTATLRAEGFAGQITLIGAEAEPPYQRPPLSKKYLTGEMERERLYLRPREFYAEEGIELRLGCRVTGIDRAARTVTFGGETLGYDALVLATGAAPRLLPGAPGGVYPLRTLADIDAMAPEFVAGRRVLIVGGGYVGLEAAAVAATRGLSATVLASTRILSRVAAPETSDYFRALHAAHGVEIIEQTRLVRLTGEGRVSGAELPDGRHLAADFVIIGIGVDAETELASMSGLEVAGGISVDDRGRTADPHVWAAGDCATFPYRGQPTRLESVQNAIDQAEAVARNILGADRPYLPNPWFWSDQYDVKLQIAGLNVGYDRVVVRPGARPGTQSTWYYRGTELLACDAMNDPRAYMTAKRLIEAGKSPDPAVVADPAGDLMALLKA